MIIFILLCLSCISGIAISAYIYRKKSRHQALACPRDNPCDVVIHSHFSYTLGIPNEILGVLYFVLIGGLLAYLLLSSRSLSSHAVLEDAIKVILLIGGAFSVYLVSLQAFVLRRWCAWCLGVACANAVLIVSTFILLN